MLLMTKGFFPLSTCENVWMRRLTLRLDPKMVFPFQKRLFKQILLMMVTHYLNLHVRPLPNVTSTITTTFDLWMSKGQHDTFDFVVKFLS